MFLILVFDLEYLISYIALQEPGPKHCARDNLRGQKSLGPLKMSLEMAHKVILPPQKKLYPAVS